MIATRCVGFFIAASDGCSRWVDWYSTASARSRGVTTPAVLASFAGPGLCVSTVLWVDDGYTIRAAGAQAASVLWSRS